MFKKLIALLLVASALSPIKLLAEEGMWLPTQIKGQQSPMRKLGLKIATEKIYSPNAPSVSGAIVGLMGEGANLRSFGTGSFISDQGLIITNYHVVMSYIERLSNAERDFIKYGYWAQKPSEETFCRGLEVKILVRMEDVTSRITVGTEGLTGREFQSKIDENGKAIVKEVDKENRDYEVQMQSVFGANQYIMSVYMVYRDVRMVAAPPMAIGKFGGDTDNYSWPRQSGDFAILRVYANADNRPAANSAKNVPYRPTSYLPISVKGVSEDDFVMIVGYPGTTRKYIPSFAVDKIVNAENVARTEIRREKMNIIKSAIEENPQLKFRYTTMASSTANSFLRWNGETQGVRRMDLVRKKAEEEATFTRWANSTPERAAEYGTILSQMEELYKQVAVYNMANLYFNEAGISGAEIVPFIGKFEKLAGIYGRKNFDQRAANSEAKRLIGLTNQFFVNWDFEIDRKVFRNMMFKYYSDMPEQFKSEAMVKYINQYDGDVEKLTTEIFKKSIFTDQAALLKFLEQDERDVEEIIKNDPLYQIAIGYYMINVTKIARQRGELQFAQSQLFDKYMKGYLEMNAGKPLYPDANGSLRISYGKVKGGGPQDGLLYTPYTTLGGAVDKHLSNPGNNEFSMSRKLLDLYTKGDYGKYGDKNGQLRVDFLNTTHTTSGNSGSPMLNARGELVGINFDRIWQGVASDFRYEPAISRAIAVDIRYVLFLIDSYSPSSEYLMSELDLK